MILPLGNAGHAGDKGNINGGHHMNLSAPTMPVFLIAVALFVLALLGHFVVIRRSRPTSSGSRSARSWCSRSAIC